MRKKRQLQRSPVRPIRTGLRHRGGQCPHFEKTDGASVFANRREPWVSAAREDARPTNFGHCAAGGLHGAGKLVKFAPMKFALAILTFALFAFFISWGIIELLKGRPWLLLAAMGVFLGTFIKFGCQSH